MARLTVVVLLALVLSGCGAAATTTPAAGDAVTVRDCQGEDVTVTGTPERVVALDGWAAQTMARLGLDDRLVGVGFTGPITALREPYRGELARVPVLAADSVPVTEVVAARSPDLVVTGFARFGGPPGSLKDADLATMGAIGVAACLPDGATDLSATYDFITKLGTIFRVPDRAEDLVGELRARERAVTAKTATGPHPRVLALADNPVVGQPVKALGGGTIAATVIDLAGGRNIFADVAGMHADVSPEKVAELDPEVIWVVTDFSFAEITGQELVDAIAANPLLASTSAARNGRILSTSQYLVGMPTPLNLDGLEQLAAGLHT